MLKLIKMFTMLITAKLNFSLDIFRHLSHISCFMLAVNPSKMSFSSSRVEDWHINTYAIALARKIKINRGQVNKIKRPMDEKSILELKTRNSRTDGMAQSHAAGTILLNSVGCSHNCMPDAILQHLL